MKSTLFIVVLILILGIGLNESFSHRNFITNRNSGQCLNNTDYLIEKLNLTKEQQKKLSVINNEFYENHYKNMRKRNAMWKLHDQHKKSIENILTNKQKEKFKNLKFQYASRRFNQNRGYSRNYKRSCWSN